MLRFLVSAILTLLLLPVFLGLFRRAVGGGGGRHREDAARSARRPGGRSGRRKAPHDSSVDRSTAIDVPYTEIRERKDGPDEAPRAPGGPAG